MNQPALERYTRIALLNILLVAGIGALLRYKIAFYFPYVDQKHLLHGHSHFAFSGWVTHLLMLMLVRYLDAHRGAGTWERYRGLIMANLITAYGMLLSFIWQGYGVISISFSTLSILVSYGFCYRFARDLQALPFRHPGHRWMRAALFFNVLSSLGAFSLAWMMATRNIHQEGYLAAVYFFLHFQYNGWFFFAAMGLASVSLFNTLPATLQQRVFLLFALACIPAYVLSALWLPLPGWVYILVAFSAVCQVVGWGMLVRALLQQRDTLRNLAGREGWLLFLPALALTIKLLLQLGSTIPSLSKLAFGYRPVVIGYLHLILLGVISLFLIAYLVQQQLLRDSPALRRALILTTAGIILNELLLMVQGVAAMQTLPLPFINEALLGAALVIFSGLLALLLSQRKTTARASTPT